MRSSLSPRGTHNSELLRWLIRREDALGFNRTQFAAQLGISQTTWSLIRHGRLPIGPDVALGAILAFPELAKRPGLFLEPDVRRSGKIAANPRRPKSPYMERLVGHPTS